MKDTFYAVGAVAAYIVILCLPSMCADIELIKRNTAVIADQCYTDNSKETK